MTSRHASNRRQFLQCVAAGATTTAVGMRTMSVPGPALAAEQGTGKPRHPLRLALASYTLRNFNLAQTLTMTQRVGLDAICLKSVHLPLESTPEQIQAAAAQVKAAGIELYGGGVITLENEAQVHQAFQYAQAAGMSKIIGAPGIGYAATDP